MVTKKRAFSQRKRDRIVIRLAKKVLATRFSRAELREYDRTHKASAK